jgi:quercetin dioxygenase-like cupin family protein
VLGDLADVAGTTPQHPANPRHFKGCREEHISEEVNMSSSSAQPSTSQGPSSVASAQAPGIKRTDLQRHDLSAPGRELIQNRVDISPEAPFIKHKHPGEEIIYVLEGSLEYWIEGMSTTTVNAGEVLLVPAETVHAVRNVGSGNAAELATYFVEKGKPFLVVVND